jgi:hypothetical protein
MLTPDEVAAVAAVLEDDNADVDEGENMLTESLLSASSSPVEGSTMRGIVDPKHGWEGQCVKRA